MQHLYTYKFRLMPTKEQEILLNKHFGCVRFIYNYFLAQRIENYKTNKKNSNCFDDINELPKLKEQFPWLKEVNSQSLQQVIKNLQIAYINFFERCKKKQKGKKGFPKFKKKSGEQSFRAVQDIRVEDNKLFINKFREGMQIRKETIKNKHTKEKEQRIIQGKIKFITISKNKINQYYVSVTVERDIQPLPTTSKTIGIDLNILENVDSDNQKEPNLRPNNKYKNKLKFLHKEVSRKQKGSKNRQKAKYKLAKLYLKVHNQREDSLHKYSRKLINENQVICIEDLSVESMLKKVKPEDRKISRSFERKLHHDIQDCGWASLKTKLEYKAKWYGRELIKVSQWFPSSQLCNLCGWQYHDLPKDCKTWTCWQCLEVNDRNYNAAKNILVEGLKTAGMAGLAYCPDVKPISVGN